MEDKENLVDWIDNQFVEHAKRLGLKLQMIDNPKNSNQENASVFGTITFLKGDSAKKAAAIMASPRGKTIRDYDEGIPYTKIINCIVQYFKSLGYKVGINEPFSNSKTFPVPVEYHSVMIEVNKRLYMNEQTLDMIDSFYKLKHDIQSLYNLLLYGQKP
jgi:hypothetical protein